MRKAAFEPENLPTSPGESPGAFGSISREVALGKYVGLLMRTSFVLAPRLLAVLLLLLASCASEGTALGTEIIEAPGATGDGTRDPTLAINGVRGAGLGSGSLDVYSLGPGADAFVVIGFDGQRFPDEAGAELVVFENAFEIGAGPYRFMDPVVVEVSTDGATFVAFPHAYSAPDPSQWSADPTHWQGFAGITPVLLNEDEMPGDPFDAMASGGDAFDLSDLPAGAESDRIRLEGFAFVRLTSARRFQDPNTGAPYPRDPVSDGPDIDGLYAR